MIIFAGGLQKSGTVWLFNLIRGITLQAGFQDVYQVRELESDLDRLFLKRFAAFRSFDEDPVKVMRNIHQKGYSIAVHTHAVPSTYLMEDMEDKWWKVIFAYRDPRAIAVSAYDHGKKNRAKGIIRPFGWIINLSMGILYARYLADKWSAWKKISIHYPDWVHLYKYEDLLEEPERVLNTICTFLDISIENHKLQEIIQAYSKEEVQKDTEKQSKLHFNIGDPNRFSSTFTWWQNKLSDIVLGRYLRQMGYEL